MGRSRHAVRSGRMRAGTESRNGDDVADDGASARNERIRPAAGALRFATYLKYPVMSMIA